MAKNRGQDFSGQEATKKFKKQVAELARLYGYSNDQQEIDALTQSFLEKGTTEQDLVGVLALARQIDSYLEPLFTEAKVRGGEEQIMRRFVYFGTPSDRSTDVVHALARIEKLNHKISGTTPKSRLEERKARIQDFNERHSPTDAEIEAAKALRDSPTQHPDNESGTGGASPEPAQ